MIRRAKDSDISTIQTIEQEAGELFRGIGMEDVADDPPPSADELRESIEDGRLFVFETADHDVSGYILLESADNECHIAQVSVLPSHSRLGIGRTLIDHASRFAKASSQPALTLTTFRDVPWNAPYYERLGFEIIEGDAIGPELKEAFDKDNRFIGDRVCMRRPIS
ncbi:MAG: GNAT family N-acetyltransferase [Actinomycetota bacterium]